MTDTAFTADDYRAAAQRALDAGDVETARSLAQRGMALEQGQPGPIARAVETAAPVAADVARSTASGLTRGAVALAEIPSLPGRAMDWALARGADFVTGGNPPEWTQRPHELNQTQPTPARALATTGEGPVAQAMEYEPQTTAGEYAQTVGEFAPGAAIGPGGTLSNVVRYGVIPGVASEAAGQATEGTAAEPYARAGAAIAAGVLSGRPPASARPVMPRADTEDARFADILMRHGVRPTVGQTTGSGPLRRIEGTATFTEGQLVDFTRAAMRTTGSSSPRATADALASASRAIVRQMDDAVRGVAVTPTSAMAQQAEDIVEDYLRATAQGNVVPDVRNIADEIIEAATSPTAQAISLQTLRQWRSRLGRLMQSSDPQTRDGAFGLRSLIDDATEAALQSAGRTEDVARLARAREQYRNWLAVADASTRAGAENGILSPTQLHQAVLRTQGRRRVAVGDNTDLGELSRAGAAILRPLPTVEAGGVRHGPLALGGAGFGALASQQATGNPLTGAMIGAALPSAMERAIMSGPIQNVLMNPGAQSANALRTIPGVLASN